jgi:DNA-binding Lrp family transcriptional regulator
LSGFYEEMYIFPFLRWTYVSGVCLGKALRSNDISNNELDSLDTKILNALLKDCRLSYSKIAAHTGISVGTAYNRTKLLEAKNIVKGYSLIVDSAKLGYALTAVIFVQAQGAGVSAMETEVAHSDCVVAVYDVTGEFDAVVIAKFKDRNELSTFLKSLAAEPFVKRTVTSVSLDTVKEDFRLQLP